MPPSRENARIWLLLVILFMTLVSRNDGPALITAPFIGGDHIGRLREAFGVLNSTKWTEFSPHETKEGAPPWSGPRYLNLTGFREKDGYAWKDLDYFKNRCHQWSEHAYPQKRSGAGEWDQVKRTWQNATGTVHGKWVRRAGSVVKTAAGYNLSAIAPGVGWPEEHLEWGWNVTGSHGTMLMRLQEDAVDAAYEEEVEEGKKPRLAGMARKISAVVDVQDEDNSAPSFAMRLHGVHWPRQGSILLTTTTEKFAGIFGLPHLALDQEFYNTSQKLLNRTLDEVLRKKERNRFSEPSNPWTPVIEDDLSIPLARCEYIMYLQLHPLDPASTGDGNGGVGNRLVSLVDKMENELRFPTGAPRKGVPDLRMSLVAWSPDCSYYLESKGPPLFPSVEGQHLVGVKSEVLLARTKNWMFAFAAVLMGQLWLLKTQMKESNTPSTLGRISFQTAAMMLLADGLVFACSSAWSLSATNTFLPSLMLTFASFMSVAIGAGFLSEIYKNQEPERRNREREREQNRANDTPVPPPQPQPAPGTLPAPVTAGPVRPASPPIIIPSDQDIDAEIAENTAAGASAIPLPTTNPSQTRTPQPPSSSSFASVAGTYAFLGVALLLLTAMSISWPPRIRAVYLNCVALAYCSLWLPQIRRNVWRNSRRAFAWRFMLGQSVLRLCPLAYFYLRRDNILFVETDENGFWALVGWVWVQLVVLAVQDVLGPRVGVPKGWVPEVWEYHPVLREDSLEAGGLPIGLVSSAVSAGRGGDGSEDEEVSSPAEGRGRKRSWSFGAGEDGEDGARRREREKELRRNGMSLRSIDCAICTEVLEVPVVRAHAKDPSAAGGLVGVFARRAYMVTPCRHIFHTKCLEGWFRYKLQCPICREELPPL